MMTTTNTTTTITNTTKTNTTTTNNHNTAQQQQRMRDQWEERVTGALFRKLKREVRAAQEDALRLRTPSDGGWVAPDRLVSMWFMPQQAADVTRHAALVEECLDDARAHAKRKKGR
jgi:hypothetical protein